MPKYRDYFRKMLEEHQEEFDAFAQVHHKYATNQAEHQEEFNRVGKPIQDILYEWEQRLCGHSEKGTYAKYSAKLAEKFRGEVKAFFPYIDFIGVKTNQPIKTKQATSQSKKSQSKKDKDIAEVEAMSIDDFDLPKLF